MLPQWLGPTDYNVRVELKYYLLTETRFRYSRTDAILYSYFGVQQLAAALSRTEY
jgi:hypothetical protein